MHVIDVRGMRISIYMCTDVRMRQPHQLAVDQLAVGAKTPASWRSHAQASFTVSAIGLSCYPAFDRGRPPVSTQRQPSARSQCMSQSGPSVHAHGRASKRVHG